MEKNSSSISEQIEKLLKQNDKILKQVKVNAKAIQFIISNNASLKKLEDYEGIRESLESGTIKKKRGPFKVHDVFEMLFKILAAPEDIRTLTREGTDNKMATIYFTAALWFAVKKFFGLEHKIEDNKINVIEELTSESGKTFAKFKANIKIIADKIFTDFEKGSKNDIIKNPQFCEEFVAECVGQDFVDLLESFAAEQNRIQEYIELYESYSEKRKQDKNKGKVAPKKATGTSKPRGSKKTSKVPSSNDW